MQAGRWWMEDSMEHLWKHCLLVDELANAPNMDCVMKIMDDMTQSQGRALPPWVPDYGLGGSNYFCSQHHFQQLQPLTIRSMFTDKKNQPLTFFAHTTFTASLPQVHVTSNRTLLSRGCEVHSNHRTRLGGVLHSSQRGSYCGCKNGQQHQDPRGSTTIGHCGSQC